MNLPPISFSAKKKYHEPHPSRYAEINHHAQPGETDTEYIQRVQDEIQREQTWKGIQQNTWAYGQHQQNYIPADKPVVQKKFSAPRENGAGGRETYLLEPRDGSVDVFTLPPDRRGVPFYQGLVSFEEDGKLPVEQYRYLTGSEFEDRKTRNRVYGDAKRAMRDYLHNQGVTQRREAPRKKAH